jgi:hypothetical protein
MQALPYWGGCYGDANDKFEEQLTFVALTRPRCVDGGKAGAFHLRAPRGGSAYRMPRKYIIPLEELVSPVKVPSEVNTREWL